MKKLAKIAAIIVGVGGAIELGYLISVISKLNVDTVTGIILVLIVLFIGGATVLGISIYLLLYSNDEFKQQHLSSDTDEIINEEL